MNLHYIVSHYRQKKLLLLSTSIIPILILISITSMDMVNGQLPNETTLLQANSGVIESQPLINEKGQTVAVGGSVTYIRDPLTGEIVPKEVRFQEPKITGPSITQTESSSNLEQNLEL